MPPEAQAPQGSSRVTRRSTLGCRVSGPDPVLVLGHLSEVDAYLAVLLISSVMGTAACLNSVSFDAQRVRRSLDQGAALWQLPVVKNIALISLVLPLGIAVSIALAVIAGRPAAPIAAIGLVLCLLLLWSGVGNI